MADRDILLEDPVRMLKRRAADDSYGWREHQLLRIRDFTDSECETIFFHSLFISLTSNPSYPYGSSVRSGRESLEESQRLAEESTHELPFDYLQSPSLQFYFQVERPICGAMTRADAEVWPCHCRSSPVVIEVDGYKWHSSKERFVDDRARSRHFAMKGVTCLRYAGSEVWKDPVHLTDELARYLIERDWSPR